jgi:hypothetical protein
MTPTDIARLRLHNQRIAHATFRTPGEVVAHLGAVQAQDFPGSKWAVGLRLPGATEADVERAIAGGEIVRTWPMRHTLHFVAAADVRWMLVLLAARQVTRAAGRYRQLGLDEDTFRRSGEALVKALSGGRSLPRPELYRLLQDAGISTAGGGPLDSGQTRGLHILAHHAQTGLICYGPHDGKQPAFVLLDEWVPQSRTLGREEALAELAKRYFASHGPATLADFTWWSGLTVREAREGIEMAGQLVKEVIGGEAYWLSRSAPPPGPVSRRAFLLPPFDEYTVAYKDRSAVLDPAFAREASYGGVFRSTIVIDGKVAGTWTRVVKKSAVVITLSPFDRLGRSERDVVPAAAKAYGTFVGMPVTVE